MQRTIFDTPVLNRLLPTMARALLRLFGWRIEGTLPTAPRFVMVAAPHTSNWDLPVMLVCAFALKANLHWMGKHTLFRPPFGLFFRWLGGLPVDRTGSHNLVDQCVQLFRDHERFAMVIAPEGTRKKVAHWKTGFYHIARGANVPVALGFIDYRRKRGGIGPVLMLSADIDADIAGIRAFYAGITGKHPGASGPPTLPSKTHPA